MKDLDLYKALGFLIQQYPNLSDETVDELVEVGNILWNDLNEDEKEDATLYYKKLEVEDDEFYEALNKNNNGN